MLASKAFEMTARPKRGNSWLVALLTIASIAIWVYQETQQPGQSQATDPAHKPSGSTGVYEIYRNCNLVEARNNDGDSFIVRLPTGKQAEFRLYFVDTPESAFKSYRGGETNHARIRQQAAEMGGITPEQAVEIGLIAVAGVFWTATRVRLGETAWPAAAFIALLVAIQIVAALLPAIASESLVETAPTALAAYLAITVAAAVTSRQPRSRGATPQPGL